MSKKQTNSNEDYVEMWIDAIQKMRQGIKMEYYDTVYKNALF
jgi:hypothetical protein